MGILDDVIYVMVGAPCSGKSHLAREICKYFGDLPYISSGEIARNMGDEVNEDLKNGKLAPEEVMRSEVANVLDKYQSFVLDGFPRFMNQYEWLKKIDANRHKLVFIIVDVAVIDAVNRNISRNRDDADVFGKRIKWFIDNTVPMINSIFKNSENTIRCTSYVSPRSVECESRRLLRCLQ